MSCGVFAICCNLLLLFFLVSDAPDFAARRRLSVAYIMHKLIDASHYRAGVHACC
jgi:hypothetical protein